MTHIVIFGIGAMGTLLGSRLNSVAKVTLFGNRPELINALQHNGLTVTHINGDTSRYHLNVTNNLNDVVGADVALIMVKSYQTARAAKQAANILKPDGLALTLQNGLGNLEILTEAVGSRRAAAGITAQGATLLGPGQLLHAGEGTTHVAWKSEQAQKLKQVVNLLNAAGLKTELAKNSDSLIWGKLAINAGINPLTALLNIPNGALIEDETLQAMMTATANETAKVAAAQGIELPFDVGQRIIDVCRATARNHSSMLQDMRRQTPTEIDAISGAIVQHGEKGGVPTPVNKILWQAIKDKEAGRTTFTRLNFEQLLLQVI